MVATPHARTAGSDGPDVAFAVEDCIVRCCIAVHGGEQMGSAWAQGLLRDLERLTASPDIDTLMRGYLDYARCVFRNLAADFDSALDRAARARQCLSQSSYMTMFIDIQVGQTAMAQGRVEDARGHYRRAQRIAIKSFALDDGLAAIARVLLHELALECHRLGAVEELRSVPRALVKGGTPFSAYLAVSGAVIDLRLVKDGVEAALGAADEMLEYVRGAGLPALVRHLSALRVSVLVSAGRAAEAERAWRLEELPEAPEGCLDLSGQSWREMEALPDDGVVFDVAGVEAAPIRDEDEYPGVRVRTGATIAGARLPIQIDVGFGDVITPEAIEIEYPALLDAPAPILRAYPPETVVAEKTEAIVSLGIANSRMKYFYDLWMIARTFAFEGDPGGRHPSDLRATPNPLAGTSTCRPQR